MKMFFLLKNNARRGMGGKGVLKKGEEKECSKRGRKRPPKFANSKTDGWVGRKFANFEGWGTLFKNFRTIPRRSHNVNKSE